MKENQTVCTVANNQQGRHMTVLHTLYMYSHFFDGRFYSYPSFRLKLLFFCHLSWKRKIFTTQRSNLRLLHETTEVVISQRIKSI